nr:hypothetical protein Iba_chr14cCG12510 [Ipomoea batatas]GMD93823.1 hypothetical protein Iba_chr14fCG11200 [Ipomoea batatas]GME10741.1 hypothetical protein Iba_scaffold10622CG0040 [Ipomoea batatas]GME21617.1 hypothetical protein Iba_scaffold28559CG0030 [Ipomoea batatas]
MCCWFGHYFRNHYYHLIQSSASASPSPSLRHDVNVHCPFQLFGPDERGNHQLQACVLHGPSLASFVHLGLHSVKPPRGHVSMLLKKAFQVTWDLKLPRNCGLKPWFLANQLGSPLQVGGYNPLDSFQ